MGLQNRRKSSGMFYNPRGQRLTVVNVFLQVPALRPGRPQTSPPSHFKRLYLRPTHSLRVSQNNTKSPRMKHSEPEIKVLSPLPKP